MSELIPISGCNDIHRKADVVFVHGLGDNAFNAWRYGKDNSTSWPHWLGDDFPQVGVWSLDYAASPSKWPRFKRLLGLGSNDSGHTMALPDRALQVLDRMVHKGLGQRPLMFIGHSLGGLLVKQLLRKASESPDPHKNAVAAQSRAVLFLATPHAGAELATLVDAFRVVFGSTVTIEELRLHDAHLRDLYAWYQNHAPTLGIKTATYYELCSVRGVIPIVNPTSANPGTGSEPVGLDEDHLSIAKPRDRSAQVCDSARNLLKNNVLTAPSPVSGTLTSVEQSTPATLPVVYETVIRIDHGSLEAQNELRIPCELPPAAEHFTGRDKELKHLIDRLRAGLNTAVVGPAGLGKTALAAAALKEFAGTNRAALAATHFPDGILYLDLYSLHGRAEPAWNTLANRLQGFEFMKNAPARNRAIEAFRARRVLLVIEGGEEADGKEERTTIPTLLRVLSPECRSLLLTRLSTQAAAEESIELSEALNPDESARLLDAITEKRPLDPAIRQNVLEMLEGHPLALNWAGNLIARDDEEPEELIRDWKREGVPLLSDPRHAERTLSWLFKRSIRGLDQTGQLILAAGGLLAPTSFPLEAMAAATCLSESAEAGRNHLRDALRDLIQRGLFRRAESRHWRFTHILAHRFARDAGCQDTALPDRLARWLNAALSLALSSGNSAGMVTSSKLLRHADALLRIDHEHALWEPLVSSLLYDIADRLEETGRLDLVTGVLDTVADWLAALPDEKRAEPFWLHHFCVFIIDRGDVLRDQGDLDGALNAFRQSLDVRKRLAAADPSHAGWQRDLSYSLTVMAMMYEQQSKPETALPFAKQSLSIDERLSALDKTNVTWQNDVEISRKMVDRLREAIR